MIFNLSSGGVSYISVTAPSGAQITAECLGLTVTGTGTCTLEAPIIGTWNITCVFDNTTKTGTVEVTSFGETYPIEFSYAATITVTTHPSASVTATKSGQTSLTGTAGSDGKCVLTVPNGGLGTWAVTSNNGSVNESGNVDVLAYDTDYPIGLLVSVPIINVTIGDNTYTYKGAELSKTGIKISPVGLTGWKFWMTSSGTVKFVYLPSAVDICIIGKGGGGGAGWGGNGYYGGGGGGGGGAVNELLKKSLEQGVAYEVTIGSSGSTFSNIASAGNGESGGSPSAGRSGGNSGDGSTGQWVNDHSWPSPTSGGGGDGGTGVYAFGDSSFDGVRYAYGGGGGPHSTASGGTRHNTAGSGGGGGGGTSNVGRTDGLTGILMMRNAA